ncbi:MAG: hypothetical protein M9894_12900 [Planctomycetes bacterium]|nr:hypothetical protein [Planctomycetota bacterium]
MTVSPRRGAALSLAVVAGVALAQGALSTRQDPDDHARFTRAVYMTAARSYVRHGYLAEGGAPLKSGGPLELARHAPYLNWPVRDYWELALWFEAFGEAVPVARARTAFWTVVATGALALGAAALLAAGLTGRARPPAAGLALAFAACPYVVYYGHAGMPQAVTIAGVCLAAAGRMRARAGRGGLALQVAGVALAVTTTWEGLLFPLVWAATDLRAGRREGPLLLGLALALVAAQVAHIAALGGLDAWLTRAASRTAPPWSSSLETAVRLARYGRGLGYLHALLALVWAAQAWRRWRRDRSTTADALTFELLLAPVPWFVVFREHVSTNDVQFLYLVPGLAMASWLALGELAGAGRPRRCAVGFVALALTGAAVGADIEHRDDWALPRELGAVLREACAPDEAAATSSLEFSIVWEADRFVHLEVRTPEELEALLARDDALQPAVFALPAAEADGPLGRALAARAPARRAGEVLVFDLRPP